jgi:hypothetical protein
MQRLCVYWRKINASKIKNNNNYDKTMIKGKVDQDV